MILTIAKLKKMSSINKHMFIADISFDVKIEGFFSNRNENEMENYTGSSHVIKSTCSSRRLIHLYNTLRTQTSRENMSRLQGAMAALIGVFHENAGPDKKLDREECKTLIQSE